MKSTFHTLALLQNQTISRIIFQHRIFFIIHIVFVKLGTNMYLAIFRLLFKVPISLIRLHQSILLLCMQLTFINHRHRASYMHKKCLLSLFILAFVNNFWRFTGLSLHACHFIDCCHFCLWPKVCIVFKCKTSGNKDKIATNTKKSPSYFASI